ncbi:MAG: hypothetical protein R3259_14540, partial [Salinimicrobium sediminis]|nr:hypothetical protein [Salinimicrobium sediminis]
EKAQPDNYPKERFRSFFRALPVAKKAQPDNFFYANQRDQRETDKRWGLFPIDFTRSSLRKN